MRRALLLLLATLSLAACNGVVSEKPLFSSRDARGAPALKPGLWALMESDQCAFDARQPPAQWPECAKPMTVTASTLTGPETDKKALRYILAAGSPRILQIGMSGSGDSGQPAYVYFALEPSPGRPITAASAWMIQCGPPPEGKPNDLTEHPLPGLSIRDKTCYATEAGAVRNAAAPSRAWGEPMKLVFIGRIAR